MQIVLRRFVNFFSKFARLSADFLRNDPIRTIPLVIINGITGILYPLPLVGLAIAGSMQVNGQHSRAYTVFGNEVIIDKNMLLIGALLIGLFIYLVRFFSSQLLLSIVNNWQRLLLGRTLTVLNKIQDYSIKRAYIADNPVVFHGWAARLSNAGIQIGLIFVYGIHSLSQIMVLTALIVFLDWRMLALLMITSVLFLPLYAKVILSIVQIRRSLTKSLPLAQIALRKHVSEIESQPTLPTPPPLIPAWGDVVGIIVVNQQHKALIVLHLLAAIHLAFMLASVVALFEVLDLALTTKTVLLFGAVFFLMRVLSGFIQFLGQLTRNYLSLADLADNLFPKPKEIAFDADEDAVVMADDGNKSIPLHLGDCISIEDSFPKSKLDYQYLAAALRPTQSGCERAAKTLITPFQEVQSLLSDKNSLNAEALPTIISIQAEEYENAPAELRENFVWAIYNNNNVLNATCAVRFTKRDNTYIISQT